MRRNRAVLVVLIGLALLARLHLVFAFEVNWDEFVHLAQVYEHARGELHGVFQTIYVHGFGWVVRVADSEVGQVVAARAALFGLSLATAAFLFLIARRLLPVDAALLALLAYLAFSFVLRQGSSFRTDPVATFLLMGGLWLIICWPPRIATAIAAGALVGLAGMVTIKSVLYVPTIALVLLIGAIPADNRRRAVVCGLLTGAAAALSFLASYGLHRLSLADHAGSAAAFVQATAGKTIGERNFLNAILTFRFALFENPVVWLIAAVGLGVCLVKLATSARREVWRWATLLACGLTLGSLFVYTNSFAYFYPFMLAPASVLCGASLLAVPEHKRPMAAIATGVALTLFMTGNYLLALGRDNAVQRQTLDVVHRIFPEPTPYIDRCSMVAAYPKKGLFMSVWGMTNYYRRGVPVMRGVLERDQPKFLLANRRMLELDDLGPEEHGPTHFGLFEKDVATLKDNFIRHWGVIYVAGKRLSVEAGAPGQEFEILIEGVYTVEGQAPVMIDGVRIQPGDTVTLEQGNHSIAAEGPDAAVVLRWGDHLYRPEEPAPERPIFTGF